MYNGAIAKKNATLGSWSEVQNQYQRRADLVPNLVEIVKGYAAHEREVLEAVTEARAKAVQINIDPDNMTPEQLTQYQTVQNKLSQEVSRLFLVAENYPQLRASENFLSLQSQLGETENRIAHARSSFIEAARDYKTYIESFPTNVTLGVIVPGKFKPIPFFEASPGTEKAPEIKFRN